MSESRILVVDDDPNMRNMLTTALSRIQGYSVLEAENGEKGLAQVRDDEPDLIISDMKMPGMTGLQLLKGVREIPSQVPFVIVTAYGTIQDAVEAMRQGATDYLEKGDPNMLRTLEVKVKKCLEIKALLDENRALREELDRRYQFVGKSRCMDDINKMVENVAQSNSTILITGESGTGKELVARALHLNSRRSKGPFIKINCAAMPDTLIESELFGHEKGSFTGALKRTRGKFELAHGGTILLDEIGEMPMPTQAKLLRVLQEKEINKIGAEAPIPIDVRIIATTNRDLKDQIEKGHFREDLFFRLNVIPFALPPLRQRKDDIAVLCDHFVKKFNEDNGYMVAGLDDAALELLRKYEWPGNVRELENAIERAVVLTKNGTLSAEAFQLSGALRKEASAGMRVGATIAEMERELIYKTLEHCQGNKTKVADMLGISIRTLRNKLNEYEGRKVEPEEETETIESGK
jgi:DNA-binding NtrC family response regulator